MKKTLLILSAALTLASAGYAQKSKLHRVLRGPLTEQQDMLLQSVLRIAQPHAGKTTAQMQRLIGYSTTSTSGGGLTDSARFFYNSLVRGSNHGTNDLSSYYFFYDPTQEYFPSIEDFLDGGPLRIKCDSAVLSDGAGIYQVAVLAYNAALRPTSLRNSYFTGGVSTSRERYTMTYDGTGLRTELLYEVDTVASGGTGPFLPDYRMYTTFGGSPARALRDSTVPSVNAPFTTDPARVSYGYTGGNLTTIDDQVFNGATYDTLQRFVLAYDGSGRVTKADIYFGFTGSLQLYFRDSLTYTGTYPFPTASYFLINNSGNLGLVQRRAYSVNAQGLRDTLRVYNGSNTLTSTTVYQYNSFGNPDIYRLFDPAISMTTPDEIGRFYYELYDPTSVKDAPAPLQAVAYPNPVRNSLALTWQRAEGAVNIQVADVSGRVLERLRLPASAAAHNMDMSHFATGTYFVTLTGAGGEAQHLKVVKQ